MCKNSRYYHTDKTIHEQYPIFFISWLHRIHTSAEIIFHFRFLSAKPTSQKTTPPLGMPWVFSTARISTSLYWYLFLSFFYQLINKSAFKKGVGMAIYSIGFTLRTIEDNWKYNSKYLKTSLNTAFSDILRYFLLGSPCVQGSRFFVVFLLLLGSPCVQYWVHPAYKLMFVLRIIFYFQLLLHIYVLGFIGVERSFICTSRKPHSFSSFTARVTVDLFKPQWFS